MIPSLSTLLFVAALWTVPATTAALLYRAYRSSSENLKEGTVTNSVRRMGDYLAATLPTA